MSTYEDEYLDRGLGQGHEQGSVDQSTPPGDSDRPAGEPEEWDIMDEAMVTLDAAALLDDLRAGPYYRGDTFEEEAQTTASEVYCDAAKEENDTFEDLEEWDKADESTRAQQWPGLTRTDLEAEHAAAIEKADATDADVRERDREVREQQTRRRARHAPQRASDSSTAALERARTALTNQSSAYPAATSGDRSRTTPDPDGRDLF